MVDRATFPSDTVSTHFVHAPGVAALERWGLRDASGGVGVPAGPEIHVRLRAVHDRGFAAGRGRRRRGLLPAPTRARHDARPCRGRCRRGGPGGVHGRRGSRRGRSGRRHPREGRRPRHRDRACDGRDRCRRASLLGRPGGESRAVPREAGGEHRRSTRTGAESAARDSRSTFGIVAAWPPSRRTTTSRSIIVGLPQDDFDAARRDVEGTFLRCGRDRGTRSPTACDQAPVRIGSTSRTDLAGYFRTPYGPGWALVGDAGYHLASDHGTGDHRRRSWTPSALADALDAVFTGRSAWRTRWAPTRAERDQRACRCTR